VSQAVKVSAHWSFSTRESALKNAQTTAVDKRDKNAQCAPISRCLCIAILNAALPVEISNKKGNYDRRTLEIFVRVLGAFLNAESRVEKRQCALTLSQAVSQ
jgi:hypothetical protein